MANRTPARFRTARIVLEATSLTNRLGTQSNSLSGVGIRRRVASSYSRRQNRTASRYEAAPESAVKKAHVPVVLFLVSLVVPWSFQIGSLALSPYRLVLLAFFVPCFTSWLSGRAGKARIADIALLSYCLWTFVSLSVNQGVISSIVPFGIHLVETMGSFLLARCFIRTADDFQAMVRTVFKIIAVLLPLALVEAVFHRNLALESFSHVVPTVKIADEEERLGLRRAQTVFEHPILFGVFCASCVSLVHLGAGYRKSFGARYLATFTVVLASLCSLSSAAIAGVAIQVVLITWNAIFAAYSARWILLLGLLLVCSAVIELISNQGIVGVYITYLTFSAQTGFYRMAIWDFGWASVLNNPIFGVGMGDWMRASWMTFSIDSFWLLNAVRWGLVGGGLIMLAFWAAFLQVVFASKSDERISQYKVAYLLTIFIYFFTGWTVHYWGTSYVFFLFLLGSGLWMLETRSSDETSASECHSTTKTRSRSRRQRVRRVSRP